MNSKQANTWIVYSRPGCGLCEEFLLELAALLGDRAFLVKVVNIDDDDELVRKYFDRIPVLTVDDEFICQYRLDAETVRRRLTY
ncbi:MAG TPA: glutaredoxin family protein [Steroidobacteraceae bacterium]|nr:glutaredoxin family protein [Steroidobacteraceae bacterium]